MANNKQLRAAQFPGMLSGAAKAPAAAAGGPLPTPEAVMGQMHLPDHMKKPFQAVVAAGLKIMFDAKSHKLMLGELQKPGPMAQKLGEGICGLMGLLVQHSNRTIAPQLLIPGGLVLMSHAADFLGKAGQPVSPRDYGEATHVMMRALMRMFKLNPDRAEQALMNMGQTNKGPRK